MHQSKSLRETVLEQEVAKLQQQFAMMHQAHLMTLATLVWYVGGTVTLSKQDYRDAKGVLLTEEMDPVAETRTFRTRHVRGEDGGEVARGGLLPPTVGESS